MVRLILLAGVVFVVSMCTVTIGQAADTEGEQLYAGNCSRCHAPEGRGAKAPRLVPFRFTDAEALRLIRQPECDMPAFPESELTDEQVAKILAYLKSLTQ